MACSKSLNTFTPPANRFWLRVNKNGFKHPKYGRCWEWTSKVPAGEYGLIQVNTKRIRTHRYSWILHFGNIPTHLCVLHKCDNRICIRPSHLFLGTHQDNFKDMRNKLRQNIGERNGFAKLTESDILLIRSLYSKGKTRKHLAHKFRVSSGNIWLIVTNKTWTHIT